MRIQRILFMSVHVWVSVHPKKRIIRSILYYLKRYQESEESDEKWLVAVHWQVENYLFLIIWKKLWDSLFAVPDFSVRSSKSNVLRYRWMSVKTTNGTREGLGRSEKNRRPFKHYWGCYRYFTLFIVKVQEILLWLLIISAYDEKHARHIFLHRFRLFKNIK